MAEPLKHFFSRALVERISDSISAVLPTFNRRDFVRDAARGLEDLELMARGRHLAEVMRAHLPADYEEAVGVIVKSLGPEHATDELEGVGMGPFFYLPHVTFVALYGVDHFDVSMRAQHELTRRFTCEFTIRPFLEKHPDKTLATLVRWSKDPSAHVRRLVSEGTRPRLPWAPRVRWIEKEPERVLSLLETLKDDPASAVRRSVANHLNDLYKGHPTLTCDIAERWLDGASAERRALVKHALRSAVKRGDRRALALLGYGKAPKIRIENIRFEPKRVRVGDSTRITFSLASTASRAQSLSVDLAVHFVKSRGQANAKVFKVAVLSLGPGEVAEVSKKISLAVHTTRKPNPGKHAVEALVNGERVDLGAFTVAS